jgi:hypothetical protein
MPFQWIVVVTHYFVFGSTVKAAARPPHSKNFSSPVARLSLASLRAQRNHARTNQAPRRAAHWRALGRTNALAHAAGDTEPKRFGEVAKRDTPCTVSWRNFRFQLSAFSFQLLVFGC